MLDDTTTLPGKKVRHHSRRLVGHHISSGSHSIGYQRGKEVRSQAHSLLVKSRPIVCRRSTKCMLRRSLSINRRKKKEEREYGKNEIKPINQSVNHLARGNATPYFNPGEGRERCCPYYPSPCLRRPCTAFFHALMPCPSSVSSLAMQHPLMSRQPQPGSR